MQHFKKQGLKAAVFAALSLSGCFSCAHAAPPYHATLYVSTTGSGSVTYGQMQNSTTPSNYYNAINQAQSNDIIEFAPGVYTKTNLGTTSGYIIAPITKSNVTLRAKNRATDTTTNRSIIRGETYQAAGYYHTFYTLNQSNITIDGFEIEAVATNNSTLQGHIGGITAESSNHIVCQYNVIHDCGGGGIGAIPTTDKDTNISTDAGDYLTADHNIIYNCCFYPTGYYQQGSGISILHAKNFNIGDTGFHNKITNNIIYNNKIIDDNDPRANTDGNGIIIDTNSGDNGSRPYTNYTDIIGKPIPKTLVENNVVYKNGGAGIHIFRSAECTVRNNSTYSNGMDTSFNAPEMDSNGGKNNLFANNISQGNPSRTSLSIFSASNGQIGTITFRSNTYWNTGGTGTNSVNGAAQSGFLNLDPKYVYKPAGVPNTYPPPANLNLLYTNPAAGIDVGSSASTDRSTTDILGLARPNHGAYDRGAYEKDFGAGLKVAPSASSG